jgi:hypothetical protein
MCAPLLVYSLAGGSERPPVGMGLGSAGTSIPAGRNYAENGSYGQEPGGGGDEERGRAKAAKAEALADDGIDRDHRALANRIPAAASGGGTPPRSRNPVPLYRVRPAIQAEIISRASGHTGRNHIACVRPYRPKSGNIRSARAGR